MKCEPAYLGTLQEQGVKQPAASIAYGSALLALAAATMSRVIVAAGLPAAMNFLHFPLIVGAAILVIPRSHTREASAMLAGIATLCATMAGSALINGAGVINVVLDLVLLGEPILLLMLIAGVPWPVEKIDQLRRWILRLLWVHVLMAWYQWLVLGLRSDDVKGVFLHQIGGHHVGGGIALIGAIYFAIDWPGRSRWARCLFVFAAASVTILADAKQVIAVTLAALLVLAACGCRHIGRAVRYLLLACSATAVLVVAAMTVFPALGTWTDPETIWEGLTHKVSVFSIIHQHHENLWQNLLGLGPGHTIGRLGWMLPDYFDVLGPLGATTSRVTQIIRDANEGHWLSAEGGSSMWSLLFSWAGLWGDLGLLGTGAYGLLCVWVWRHICKTDLSRFVLLNLLGLGCVYAWLEEPAYALLVAALIGVRYRGNANTLRT
ncbi:MAG: hypothetical protein ACM359_24285 [Bacillota bacterium]